MEKIEAQNVKLKIRNRKLKYELEKLKEIEEEHKRINGELREENEELKDNWNKLKEIIDIKMYNSEYLTNLCGYKVDVDTLAILKIIKEEMQELEQGSDNDE